MPEIQEKIIPVFIEEEMRNSYIDYSMSVIVSRALPDVRDGLKPVHRRVLYGMLELGLRSGTGYKKSARIVGEVLGKYHPHGDTAVYDAMVRMVQDFTLRYPLVDGQGNFGSVDGDSPAAMRYTEARLAPIAEEVLRDIDKDTVDFVLNFDDTLQEPSVLPSLLPTLLVNGASGIAVGMATNIPPHNLAEVVDALIALIDKPSLAPMALKKYMFGPDFPTGAMILGVDNIDAYFQTGRGKLIVRARVHVEDMIGNRQRLVISEIPYQVNKVSLIERIVGLARDKKIDGLSEVRDESDREGLRIVIELRREGNAEKVIQDLYRYTQMEMTFGVILLALVDGQPKILNIKEILQHFIDFRHTVVLRRTKYDLDKAEKRAHILEGLITAQDNIDEIVSLIRKSRTVDTARQNLMRQFQLSEIQAQAILDMRLQRLTGLERKKIEQEYLQVIKLIEKLKSLLASKPRRMQLIKEELSALKDKYGDPRKTQIIGQPPQDLLNVMMSQEKAFVTLSSTGMAKKFSLTGDESPGRLLKRAGDGDLAEHSIVSADSHYLLFFTDAGFCHRLRTNLIPLSDVLGSGTLLDRFLRLKDNEKIISVVDVARFEEGKSILMATRHGLVKKVALPFFSRPREPGFAAISLKDADTMVAAAMTTGEMDIVVATAAGQAIRFSEQDVRDMGLPAGGIKGITLANDDVVVGLIPLTESKPFLLSLTNMGYGKRTPLKEYRSIRRGGKGIANYRTTAKTGRLVSVLDVAETDQVVLFTNKGRSKTLRVKAFKIMRRAVQGAPVVSLGKNDEIVKATRLPDIWI